MDINLNIHGFVWISIHRLAMDSRSRVDSYLEWRVGFHAVGIRSTVLSRTKEAEHLLDLLILKLAHFFLIKGGKTEQIFLTCSSDVYQYLVKNSGQYLTRLKSYESLKKRKLGDCSVSFVRDSTLDCFENQR